VARRSLRALAGLRTSERWGGASPTGRASRPFGQCCCAGRSLLPLRASPGFAPGSLLPLQNHHNH